jgi:hypothetical protein
MKDRLALILLIVCYVCMAVAVLSMANCVANRLSPQTTTQKKYTHHEEATQR